MAKENFSESTGAQNFAGGCDKVILLQITATILRNDSGCLYLPV
jgi:hypothetical protein